MGIFFLVLIIFCWSLTRFLSAGCATNLRVMKKSNKRFALFLSNFLLKSPTYWNYSLKISTSERFSLKILISENFCSQKGIYIVACICGNLHDLQFLILQWRHPHRAQRLKPLAFTTMCAHVFCQNTRIRTAPYIQSSTLPRACHTPFANLAFDLASSWVTSSLRKLLTELFKCPRDYGSFY